MNRVEDQPREPQFRTAQNSIRREVVNIGKSVFVKGELTGDEDLTIEGRVEGRIELADHKLVIGPNGRIRAEINAKEVTVIGSVEGNLSVQGLLEITSSGSVKGDIKASRISIADGAYFRGTHRNATKRRQRREVPFARSTADREETGATYPGRSLSGVGSWCDEF